MNDQLATKNTTKIYIIFATHFAIWCMRMMAIIVIVLLF